jgi:hypothetical protein
MKLIEEWQVSMITVRARSVYEWHAADSPTAQQKEHRLLQLCS